MTTDFEDRLLGERTLAHVDRHPASFVRRILRESRALRARTARRRRAARLRSESAGSAAPPPTA